MFAQRHILIWTISGLACLGLLVTLLPGVYPLSPQDWRVSRGQARELALEHLRQLGELPEDPYVVTRLVTNTVLELELLELRQRLAPPVRSRLEETFLGREVSIWEVLVYDRGAAHHQWRFQARVTPDGEIRALRIQGEQDTEDEAAQPPRQTRRATSPLAPSALPPPLSSSQAQTLAAAFLAEQGYDLQRLGESAVRVQQFHEHTDVTVTYTLPSPQWASLDELAFPAHGLTVTFTGERLNGFFSWFDVADPSRGPRLLRDAGLLVNGRWLAAFLLVPLVGIFFVRRYHAGEVGVRTGVQLWLLVFGCSAVFLAFIARPASQDFPFDLFSREQSTWVWGAQMLATFFFPLALLCFLAWSVGEAVCRERWGDKLAAFDAVLRGRWRNATVAVSMLRGSVLGLALCSLLLLGAAATRGAFWAPLAQQIMWSHQAEWMGLSVLAFEFVVTLYAVLLGQLLVVSSVARRYGAVPAVIVSALLHAVLFFPPLPLVPLLPALLFGAVVGALLALIFLRYDLLVTLWTLLVVQLILAVAPFLGATDPWLRLQSVLPLVVLALPLLLTLRYLRSCEEFVYRYDDVPPHVQRIVERERQRVELETARGIQSSILPDLPPSLAGVQLAHAYQPATEVGGDFYDVLELDDGRLAVAVGDVAGHGVSSGLIMSMAKSALAVQVSFDPSVEAVLQTLNRLIYQSARRRLLTTLFYCILDPRRREVVFASAGHHFPYRTRPDGALQSLESVSYPLGARPELRPQVRRLQLAAGDSLVLFSDGLVEARAEGSDDLFGFERLEQVLAQEKGAAASRVRDAILQAVNQFVGYAPQEDDRTVLVLQLPNSPDRVSPE